MKCSLVANQKCKKAVNLTYKCIDEQRGVDIDMLNYIEYEQV